MTQEWEAVAWAMAAFDHDVDVANLDLEHALATHGSKARVWLVARDAAHEWQIRQRVEIVTSEPTDKTRIDFLENELRGCRENLHRVTNELRTAKREMAAAAAAPVEQASQAAYPVFNVAEDASGEPTIWVDWHPDTLLQPVISRCDITPTFRDALWSHLVARMVYLREGPQ